MYMYVYIYIYIRILYIYTYNYNRWVIDYSECRRSVENTEVLVPKRALKSPDRPLEQLCGIWALTRCQ